MSFTRKTFELANHQCEVKPLGKQLTETMLATLLFIYWLTPISAKLFMIDEADVTDMAKSHIQYNWGIAFYKVGAILNGISQYKHTFAVAIPNTNFEFLQVLPCNTTNLRLAHCEAINMVVNRLNNKYGMAFATMKKRLDSVLNIIGNIEVNSVDKSKINNNNNNNRKRRVKRDIDDKTPTLSPDFCKNGKSTEENVGLFGVIGRALGSAFGMPSYSDFKTIYKHICELADTIDINKDEIVKSNERLSSISSALNNRISVLQGGLVNLNARITETQQRLVQFSKGVEVNMKKLDKHVLFLEEVQEHMYYIMGTLQLFEFTAQEHLHNVNNWIAGVYRLLEGYIPFQLISTNDIETVLKHVDKTILRSYINLRLVHPNPAFYYQMKHTVFTRSNNYLFITLHVPISDVGGILGVYRIDTLHLRTAEHLSSSTKIVGLPDFFAITPNNGNKQYYMEISLPHFMSCKGEDLKICETSRSLQSTNVLTCAAALFFDKNKSILEKCDIRYEHTDLSTEVIKIDDDEYLVHSQNASKEKTWTMQCGMLESTTNKVTMYVKQIQSCNTCVIEIPCGCSLDGGEFMIPTRYSNCNITSQSDTGYDLIQKRYPVSMPTVTNLLSNDMLNKINGKTLFSSVSNNNPYATSSLSFNITRSKWNQVVARDKLYQADFQRLMKLHKNKSIIYATKSEEMLKKATDFSDLNKHILNDIKSTFSSKTLKALLNPKHVVGTLSIFWILAIITIIMSLYNCWRVHVGI